jgi:two-component system response regulator AtoC
MVWVQAMFISAVQPSRNIVRAMTPASSSLVTLPIAMCAQRRIASPSPRPDSYPFTRSRLLAIWRGAFASVPLPEAGQILVGRGLAADLCVGAESVSREHALVVAGEPPCIIDADSANGVHVDGARLSPGQAIPFEHHSIVELGEAFLLIEHSLVTSPAPPANGNAGMPPPPSPRPERSTQLDVLENAVERVRRLEPPSARLQRLADTIATTSLSVLLLGEPGVGKATLAKRLHRRSPRAGAPFLSIDCAALVGAGAQASSSLLRDAWGGTVLLENVGELPLAAQAELLEAVGEANALGARWEPARACDVRLIATSSRDLRELVAEHRFRADLYLRLGGVQLVLAPLRKRSDEILPLSHQFLVEASGRSGLPVAELDPEARVWLQNHAWPGNLLELRRVMERALARSQGEPIELGHLQRARDFTPASVGVADAARAVSLCESLPEPERPTNPFASAEPMREPHADPPPHKPPRL